MEQVKAYIQKDHNVLVYDYLPFCSGESGCPPMEVKDSCEEKGLKCLVGASVYDGIFPILATYTFPMQVIDHQVFETDNYQNYGDLFYRQLTGNDDPTRKEDTYHVFRNGKYVRSLASLVDL